MVWDLCLLGREKRGMGVVTCSLISIFYFYYQLYHRDACISCFLSLVFFYISFC